MIATLAGLVVLAACGRGGEGGEGGGGGGGGARAAGDSSCDTPRRAPEPSRGCELPADDTGRGGAADTLHPAPDTRLIVFLGTSLTAGLGLDPSDAYPSLIQRRLDSLELPYRAVNAGVSGETSAGALRRLAWVLRQPPAVLVVETGANDGLRGLELDSTRANLEAIVRRARAAAPLARIVLAGMQVPTNLGAPYAARFRALYAEVAAREHVTLIPFLLAGVGGVDSLNQADGIHPNRRGERIVADNVWRVLRPLLATPAPRGPA